jgi:3-oxoacyl-[acyl-carrier-protein] synthase II
MDTVLVFGAADAHAPAPRRARRVVVTGAAVVTPEGLFDGAAVAALPTRASAGEAVGSDLAEGLDRDRARRLDRASRLAAIVVGRALGPDARDAGVVLGNAFGAVDATAVFMRRLAEKGARLVSPAEFPSLVPSSPAGHVSIYLGLSGPTMVVADLATSGECAVTQGYELVASGEAERLAVVAVEEKSAFVDAIFRVVFGLDHREGERGARPLRREGAGAVALASEDAARARGLPVLACVEQVLAWTHGDSPLAELTPPPAPVGDLERALVVLGERGAAIDALLDRSAWAGARRISCAEHCGSHEAVGGIAIAVAAATLAAQPAIEAVLCVGSARGSGHAIVLGRWRAGQA